jgi:uncharacterized membrane protein
MKRTVSLLLHAFLLTSAFTSCRHEADFPPVIAGVADSILFDSQVQPVITSNCAMSGCHNGANEFSLQTYAEIRNWVEPGKPNKSKLYEAITTNAPAGEIMPPDPRPRLTNNQVNIIQLWIMEGAHNTSSANYCDSVHVNFSGTIRTIVENNCLGCHSGAFPAAGLNLTEYENLKEAFIARSALDHILGQNGFSLMPPTGMLQSCNIAQIKKWINDGLPQN